MTAGEQIVSAPVVPRWLLKDCSDLPDDWLEVFLFIMDEDDPSDADGKFAARIEAIYRLRDIERREGNRIYADHRNARAEKLRREGKPVPVERYQVYDWNGTAFEVTRMSASAGWAELRCASTGPAKRHRLPLPAEARLIGWMR